MLSANIASLHIYNSHGKEDHGNRNGTIDIYQAMEWARKEKRNEMKKLALIVMSIMLLGCATGSLRIDPDQIKALQDETKAGSTTSGCVSTTISATSGVVGGTGRAVVTWGDIEQTIIDWCTAGR